MDCSLVMLAGPDDAGHVRLLFNHAMRTACFPFSFRALTIDTLSGGRGDPARIEAVASQMLNDGEIDAVFRTSDEAAGIERKHFGQRLHRKRDFRGIPLLGWAIGIERAPTDYVCHFDCDILMHSAAGYSWVAAAIDVLCERRDVMFVAPKGGPGADAAPREQKDFSSRRFVVDRGRLANVLPLPATHNSWKRRLLMLLGGASSYWPWETHVRAAMERSPFSCLYLGDARAWSIHCPDHGLIWRETLPDLVRACEAGTFPDAQKDDVELALAAWLERTLQ